MEDNEEVKAMAENPLCSGRSKHIDVRWHLIRELVEKKELKVVHSRKYCMQNCSKGTVRHY